MIAHPLPFKTIRMVKGRRYLKDLIREIRKDKIEITFKWLWKACFFGAVLIMLVDIIRRLLEAINTLPPFVN